MAKIDDTKREVERVLSDFYWYLDEHDDAVRYSVRDEFVVDFDEAKLVVGKWAGTWTRPSTLELSPEPVGTLHLAELDPAHQPELFRDTLRYVVDIAQRCRRASYRECGKCQEETPPERMHDGETCMRCAKRIFGILY